MKQTKRLRIALLFGGRGAEHDISLKSAASVALALSSESELICVGITKVGEVYLYTGTPDKIENGTWEQESSRLFPTSFVRLGQKKGLLLGGAVLPVDVVFPVLHGDFGEDGKVQGWLESIDLPYVGSRPLAGALCQDKALTKIIAEHLSIPTVPWCVLRSHTPFAEAKLQIRAAMHDEEYPLILKPTALGSSIGVFTVRSDAELRSALCEAAPYGDMLVERYLPRVREVEVCYLDTDEEHYFVGEVNLPERDTPYTYEKKYNTKICPVREEPPAPSVEQALRYYSRALVELLSIRGVCRLDFFLTETGKIYFNEINTFPGFSSQSFYPQMCEKGGFDYKTLLLTLCEVAYDRHIR